MSTDAGAGRERSRPMAAPVATSPTAPTETLPQPRAPHGAMSYPDVLSEAARQMDICNACRYCEGYCAVFPAIERRQELGLGDLVQVSNLCHDCRACFDACMYTAPHEFDINPPKILSAVRLGSYDRYLWPATVPGLLTGWRGILVGTLAALALVFGVALPYTGFDGLVAAPGGAQSPYDVIPYGPLLAILLVPAVYSIALMARGGWLFWRDVGGGRIGGAAVGRTLKYALTMRYQRGGGAQCFYPDDEKPSPLRRRLHHAVFYGFLLCIVSTCSAAVLQDILGSMPPYPLVSAPVLTGTVGGAGIVVGCLGLLILKVRSSPVTGLAAMTVKDYGFLVALSYLGVTGFLVLGLRGTAAFGLVFLAHLAAIVLCFAAAPYTKFVHFVYRVLAILKDNVEDAGPKPG